MPHLFVRHGIENFDAWKPAFDEDASNRISFGITQVGLHRDVDDPNKITAVFEVESVERAQEYLQSPELREGMEQAGVQGMPEMWFTD